MKKLDSVFVTGITLIVLWLSCVPYLLEIPLYPTPGIQEFSKEVSNVPGWVKDEAKIANKTQSNIQSDMVVFLRIEFVKSLILYLLGILSGVLILKRYRSGRFLAIGVSSYVLLKHIARIAFCKYPLQRLHFTYIDFFSLRPFQVIHLQIVLLLVLVLALIHLLRPSIAKQFEKNED